MKQTIKIDYKILNNSSIKQLDKFTKEHKQKISLDKSLNVRMEAD